MVTGGCVFIGSEVTRQLSTLGSKVTVIDNLSSEREEHIKALPNVSLIKADVSDETAEKLSIITEDSKDPHKYRITFVP